MERRPLGVGDRMDFEIKLTEDLDLSESVVVVAFPTVGVVGSLAASYLVSSQELEQIGRIHSDLYPPAAIVRDGRPSPPVRIYAGEQICGPEGSCARIVVVYSEVPPPEPAQIPMARALLDWTAEARHLVVLEGFEADEEADVDQVEGVASSDAGCRLLDDHKIHCLSDGVVTGLAGAMLNEGVRMDREVVCLVAPAQEGRRDSEGAAGLLEAVDKLVVETKFDLQPLLEWADEEGKRIRSRIEKSQHRPDTAPPMYG